MHDIKQKVAFAMRSNHHKKDFIVKSLAKLGHKPWESYIIHRIINKIDDLSIEFVCQQYVRSGHENNSFTDLFFPQFRLHLEVDEPFHGQKTRVHKDNQRSEKIIKTTGHSIERIKIYTEEYDVNQSPLLSIEQINQKCDDFAAKVLTLKKKFLLNDAFQPWDFNKRFDPTTYIKKGVLEVEDRPMFSTHADAMRCFGYLGGNYQRAVWRNVPQNPNKIIWFPKLYKNKEWDNELIDDGKKIVEVPILQKDIDTVKNGVRDETPSRIVFAHCTDIFGKTFYKFVGEFIFEKVVSCENGQIQSHYRRISTTIKLT